MIRLFDDMTHVMLYQRYRPVIPEVAVSAILKYLEEKSAPPHGTCVDVGCGSGQSTPVFAPHFQKVIGYDVSDSQVEAARTLPDLPKNVSFQVAPAEALPFPDNSVTVVTGCTSFHWFDLPKFYKEVDRILKPNGVVAAVGHVKFRVIHPTKNEQLDTLMATFVDTHLRGRYHENIALLTHRYRDLPMPYDGKVRLDFPKVKVEGQTVADLVGYYKTWSCFQSLYLEDPKWAVGLLEDFQRTFLEVMGATTPPEETPITTCSDYFVVMSRKPAE